MATPDSPLPPDAEGTKLEVELTLNVRINGRLAPIGSLVPQMRAAALTTCAVLLARVAGVPLATVAHAAVEALAGGNVPVPQRNGSQIIVPTPRIDPKRLTQPPHPGA